jgi:hypothetical protein
LSSNILFLLVVIISTLTFIIKSKKIQIYKTLKYIFTRKLGKGGVSKFLVMLSKLKFMCLLVQDFNKDLVDITHAYEYQHG